MRRWTVPGRCSHADISDFIASRRVRKQDTTAIPKDAGPPQLDRRAMATTDTFKDLTRMATTVTFQRNRAVYLEGGPAEYCYRVVAGVVRICKATEDGRRQIAAFPKAGDIFGWTGNRCHTYAAEAASEVLLLRWPRQAIETALISDPETAHRLLAILFEQLAATQNHLFLLGRMHASERLASFLLHHAEHYERNGLRSTRIPFPIGRRDLGDHLGLTVETVSRTMNTFKKCGLIDFVLGQSVQILDRQELAQIADGGQ